MDMYIHGSVCAEAGPLDSSAWSGFESAAAAAAGFRSPPLTEKYVTLKFTLFMIIPW